MLESLPGKIIVKNYVEAITNDDSFHKMTDELRIKIKSIDAYNNTAGPVTPAPPLIQYL
jgi:hypothetical protein